MQLIISEGKAQHEMKIEKGRLICLLLIPLASLACKNSHFLVCSGNGQRLQKMHYGLNCISGVH